MTKRYFSILEKIDGKWTVQFGDYVKNVVYQEKLDMIDSGNVKSKDLTIITTADDQASIDAAVAKLNAP